MKLSDTDLQFLSDLAQSAATKAGVLIASYADKEIEVLKKQAGESLASQVLTEADLKSQEIILDLLLPTCESYDIALLSEEKVDDHSRLKKDYFWCIDPLDGTLPFTEGRPGYAVSIALVSRSGESVIGVIYNPLVKDLYHAVKGGGAYRNGKCIVPCDAPTLDSLTFITDRSFTKNQQFNECLKELNILAIELGCKEVTLIQHGGAAMNACWVLDKSPACYFKFPKPQEGGGSLWDYAASACIFKEAGFVATDIYGSPLDLNRPNSTFMNHHGILYASNNEISKRIINHYIELTESEK